MTILAICAVFDTAIQAHAQPMFVSADGQATRSFTNEVNRADEKNVLYTNPNDFELYHLGLFNDETGEFTSERRLLARAQDLITK